MYLHQALNQGTSTLANRCSNFCFMLVVYQFFTKSLRCPGALNISWPPQRVKLSSYLRPFQIEKFNVIKSYLRLITLDHKLHFDHYHGNMAAFDHKHGYPFLHKALGIIKHVCWFLCCNSLFVSQKKPNSAKWFPVNIKWVYVWIIISTMIPGYDQD